MEKVKLGRTELKVSELCFGGGRFGEKIGEADAFELLDYFTSFGGNFIDTANVYCRWVPGAENCSEQIIGRWLKSRGKKQEVVIATKGGHYDLKNPAVSRVNKKEIRRDITESLEALSLECIDFYWLHRDDETKDIREIIDMMEDFRKEGLIRYYGASNYRKYRMAEAAEHAGRTGIMGFSALSNEYSMAVPNPSAMAGADPSLIRMNQEYLRWMESVRMPLVPYSSQAQGYFSKKLENALNEKLIKTYENEENGKTYEMIREMAGRKGISIAKAALEMLKKESFQVIPIVAATSVVQLGEILQ